MLLHETSSRRRQHHSLAGSELSLLDLLYSALNHSQTRTTLTNKWKFQSRAANIVYELKDSRTMFPHDWRSFDHLMESQ